jgi:hypothetical protein
VAFQIQFEGMAEDLAAAFSGAVGQFVGTAFTFPFDVVKTRMMAETGKASQLEMMMAMFKEDGLLGVYRRFPSKGLQQGTTRFTYYYLYSYFSRTFLIMSGQKGLGFWTNLLIGYVVGVLNMIPSNPLELVTNVIMNSKTPLSIGTVCNQVYAEKGWMGFYTGWWTSFVTALNPAIQNTVFDQVKVVYLANKARTFLSMAESFWLGAFAKAIATVVTFPYSRAKVMLTTATKKNDDGKEEGVMITLYKVMQEEGVAALFQGLVPSLTKAVLQSAVMLMVREKLDENTKAFILTLFK